MTKILRYVDDEEHPTQFEYQRVAKGMFATIYIGETHVLAVVDDDCYDKEIVAECHREAPDNPHIPSVHLDGYIGDAANQKKVYRMPRYQKLQKGSKAKKDYNRIRKLLLPAMYSFVNGTEYGSDRIYAVLNVIEDHDEPVLNALEDILRWSLNYGSQYICEWKAENIAQDANGNLVWLDMVFDQRLRDRAAKRIDEAQRERRERIEARRQWRKQYGIR